jgi:hypothetical protein
LDIDSDNLVQLTFFATDCFDKLSTSSQIGTDFPVDQGRKKSTITAVASRLPVLCPPDEREAPGSSAEADRMGREQAVKASAKSRTILEGMVFMGGLLMIPIFAGWLYASISGL